MTQHLPILIGALFILVYSYGQFNMPPTNRSCTTAFRYHLGASLYTFAILTLYFVLAALQRLFQSGTAPEGESKLLAELSDPLLAALMLTVLLPNTPWLSEIDRLLRKQSQKMAAIPYEVRRLSQELKRVPLDLTPHLRQQVHADLLRRGIGDGDVMFDKSNTPQHTLTMVASLMACLKSWEIDSRFAAFAVRFSTDWESLRHDYDRLTAKAAKRFRFARDIAEVSSGDERSRDLAAEYLSSFQDQTEELLERLYNFVARAALDSEITVAARTQRLSKLGFRLSKEKPPIDSDLLVGVFLLLFLVTIVLLAVIRPFEAHATIRLAVIISLSHLLAVLSSLTLKRRRAAVELERRVHRPWAAYLCSGLAAVGAVSILSFTNRFVDALATPDAWLGWVDLLAHTGESFVHRGTPWLMMCFTTAFVIAFHLDNVPTGRLTGRRLQVVEALSQALMTGFAGFGAWSLLGNKKPALLDVLLIAAILGLTLGATVPVAWRAAAKGAAQADAGSLLGEPSRALPASVA